MLLVVVDWVVVVGVVDDGVYVVLVGDCFGYV